MKKMLIPDPIFCETKDMPADNNEFDNSWLSKLGNAYAALYLQWPGDYNLPPGYRVYVVSFNIEAVDIEWVNRQSKLIDAPIIVLSDSNFYNWPAPDNVYCYTLYEWHTQCEQMIRWHNINDFPNKDIKYKASALCNRPSQSKMVIFTALAEYLGMDDCLLTLGDDTEERRIHKFGDRTLDNLINIFDQKYRGKEIRHDDFDNSTDNHHGVHSNTRTSSFQECAVNFSNESFHYSHMEVDGEKFTWPGPFLTEKTFKCLLSATALIPVGQYDTLGSLSRLGFNFDYGFNTQFDNDVGNITRHHSIVDLIKSFVDIDAQTMYNNTVASSKHNFEFIVQGGFSAQCIKHNQVVQERILDKFA